MRKPSAKSELVGKRGRCEACDLVVFRRCIGDARGVLKGEGMMDMQSHVLSVAIALFNKRFFGNQRGGG